MKDVNQIMEVQVDLEAMQANLILSDAWRVISPMYRIYMLTDVIAQLTSELDFASQEWKAMIDSSRQLEEDLSS